MASHAPDRPPLRLGERFLVVDHLGDGGTAIVYLAWDEVECTWCALKVLQHKFLNDPEMRQRFAQEADALQLLAHPNVPRLIHHDTASHPPFMAMELARRGSAMDWVRKNGPMPPTMAADVMFQVCEALAEAHAAGVVHRDVKPHNFLLDENGLCKLTDFGIARMPDNESLTATGSQIGTFSFMAPEQRSDTKSVDHRADVYSVGASLYTLLSAKTSAELFVADQDDDLLEDVNSAFRSVVVKATRYRPEERYASVLELQTDLMNALSRIPPASDDFPPLAQPVAPLPSGPPQRIPTSRAFPDLERSVGRTPPPRDDVSTDELQPPHQERSKGMIPYYMPERTPAILHRRDQIPDYLDESERGSLRRQAEAQEQRRMEEELAAEVHRSISEASELNVRELEGTRRVLTRVFLGAAVFAVLLGGVFLAGMVSVSLSRGTADRAATGLTQTLQQEVAVVYELPGDRTQFEKIYERYRSARGDARVGAALEFVAALDVALADGAIVEASTEAKIEGLRNARDAYVGAHEDWESSASGFPGILAVWVGLARAP